ncbi:M14 family zinc carboxypeptidase [Pseudidiomarina sp. E22-M8]|uniref:M14 family zinc carboxypeptidase n=1 Tax=Pseudidiomarina sp. E22-M8 TaxID=3424768 RepID=UPI00403C458D
MSHPDAAIAALEQEVIALQWTQLDRRHLTYPDIAPIIDELTQHEKLKVTTIGESYLGTPIRRLSLGQGPLIILAWTQMHGDEPTATAAVLDWLRLLLERSPGSLPTDWHELITLHVIPMLNPDGAAQEIRQNGQGIDINRDALVQQTPEGRLLWQQVQRLQPTVAFNLHDQNPYYAVGDSAEPATIAFLAPAYHPDKHVDSARLQAKQLIAHMRHILSHWLPQGIARYDDSYSARSFGDRIAGAGASTILIESGAHRDDPHRQVARRLNVIALQVALEAVLSGAHRDTTLADYYGIPGNTADGFCDIKLCQITLNDGTHEPFQTDICLCLAKGSETLEVDFIGDARGVHGFVEHDARELTLPGLVRIGDDAAALLQRLGLRGEHGNW